MIDSQDMQTLYIKAVPVAMTMPIESTDHLLRPMMFILVDRSNHPRSAEEAPWSKALREVAESASSISYSETLRWGKRYKIYVTKADAALLIMMLREGV